MRKKAYINAYPSEHIHACTICGALNSNFFIYKTEILVFIFFLLKIYAQFGFHLSNLQLFSKGHSFPAGLIF